LKKVAVGNAQEKDDSIIEVSGKSFDIEFRNLSRKLSNGKHIMKGVSGTLYSGRCCAIMGSSGAGKVGCLIFLFYDSAVV
jgi:ABC-type multidrug transport system fused ATPase/permease subunit